MNVKAKSNGHRRVATEILDREPPFNLDAESGVLGSIVLNPDVCDDVTLIVRPADFYDDAHRRLYEHLVDMHGSGGRVDLTLLVERLKSAGDYERIGGAAFIARTAQSVPNHAHASYYAKIVREKSLLRGVLDVGTELVRAAYGDDDGEAIVARAEESISALRELRTDAANTKSAREVMHTAMDNIDARKNGVKSGILTGFTELDSLIGGMRPKTVTIEAGRTGMGKTAWALNVLANVAIEDKIPTLFVSLEMSADEIGDRLLASVARVDSHHIQQGTYSSEESRRLTEAAAQIAQGNFQIDDAPSRTIGSIAALARRQKRKGGLEFLIIDYLQLIAPESQCDTRQEEVATISRRIKGLARELNIPILCLAQVNRQKTESAQDNRPKLWHLRESGAIEQDADVVIFVHRPGYFADKSQGGGDNGEEAELIVEKHRGGRTGSAKVLWFGSYVRFDNAAQPRMF